MDEASLQHRLDLIERRQWLILSLIVVGYVFAGLWILMEEVDAVTPYNAGLAVVVLAIVAGVIGTYRRRQARH